MKHLPLIIAVFLILVAGFVASNFGSNINGSVYYNQGYYSQGYGDMYSAETVYRTAPTGRPAVEIPTSRFDFNKDGVINKDDYRDHNNILRRCLDQLWGQFCIPELDIDGNGRYEYIDNRILYQFVLNPTSLGLSETDAYMDRTSECELGRIRCFGDQQYKQCIDKDGNGVFEWSKPLKLQEPGKECRYGKITPINFNVDY